MVQIAAAIWCGLFILAAVDFCAGAFSVPDVQLQAFYPKGFKAYIPDTEGIKLFNFNGKRNENIKQSEPGEISGEAKRATNGKWVVNVPDLELAVGDVINFWVFIQHDRLGYRKEGPAWTVTELITNDVVECINSTTTVSDGGQICAGQIIFEDQFNGNNLDETQWIIEQYKPLLNNAEFVSYQKSPDTVFVKNSNLYLKPVVHNNVRGTLDLTAGCTSTDQNECLVKQIGRHYLPPIKSGKIKTKRAFRYGKVEIRARLPAGDWIFPRIELTPAAATSEYKRIVIAYARGNEKLTLPNTFDIGATMFYGGPISSIAEPARSSTLKMRTFNSPVNKDAKIFTLTWRPDRIVIMVDNEEVGSISANSYSGFDNMFHLTLGVGVGGNYDFPEGVASGSFTKPWKNDEVYQLAEFYNFKANWENTWNGDSSALAVDYVKIWAL